MTLNARQLLFSAKYVELLHETKAAIAAGYSAKTAYSQASRLLKNVEVQAEIERLLSQVAMGKNEVLYRLTEIGRADIDDIMAVQGGLPFIDIEKAQQAAKTGLIKKIKVTKQGIEFELHDKMRALELLGKHHALFTDVVQHDWRKQAEAEGVDPAQLFEELIEHTRQTIAASAGSAHGGGVGGGEEAGE